MKFAQKITYEILTKTRKVISHIPGCQNKTRCISNCNVNVDADQASKIIVELIESNEPCMISRFGSTELNCVVDYLNSKKSNKHVSYLAGKIDSYCYTKSTIKSIKTLSGVFPNDDETMSRFARLVIEDLSYVDLLGSWLKQEERVSSYMHATPKADLHILEPYYHENPWSQKLENKKILVVHPFVKTISLQYNKRETLFKDKRVLPKFDLQTYKSVQSLGGDTSYKNWFEALKQMKDDIDLIDFDVAIIGCGAYGMPLAAHIKRTGRKAIHLGGATQLLFGIMGKRWEEGYDELHRRINIEHWARPLPEERPEKYQLVERGCYW